MDKGVETCGAISDVGCRSLIQELCKSLRSGWPGSTVIVRNQEVRRGLLGTNALCVTLIILIEDQVLQRKLACVVVFTRKNWHDPWQPVTWTATFEALALECRILFNWPMGALVTCGYFERKKSAMW